MTVPTSPSLITRLVRFLLLVACLAPVWLWWALAGLLFTVLNGVFYEELWPNTPQATNYLFFFGVGCFLVTLWATVGIAKHLRSVVASRFWSFVYYIIWLVGTTGAILLTTVVGSCCLGLLIYRLFG